MAYISGRKIIVKKYALQIPKILLNSYSAILLLYLLELFNRIVSKINVNAVCFPPCVIGVMFLSRIYNIDVLLLLIFLLHLVPNFSTKNSTKSVCLQTNTQNARTIYDIRTLQLAWILSK